jgi:hypothetical protein
MRKADLEFLQRVPCEATEEIADVVLRLAQQPDFFVFEGECDEGREVALGVLGTLVMPRAWTEKARSVLQEIAAHDSPRCMKLAQEALFRLNENKLSFWRVFLSACGRLARGFTQGFAAFCLRNA